MIMVTDRIGLHPVLLSYVQFPTQRENVIGYIPKRISECIRHVFLAILQLNTFSMTVHCPEDKIYISARNADFSSFGANEKL